MQSLQLPTWIDVAVCTAIFMALRCAALLLLLWRQRRASLQQQATAVRLRRRASRAVGTADAAAGRAASASTAIGSSPGHSAVPAGWWPSGGGCAASPPIRTLVILGSGGHTAEMLAVLDLLPRDRFAPLLFVRAATDSTSEARARRREEEKGNRANCDFVAIPRSREVGQSYLTSVWTTLVALAHSLWIVFHFKPQMILCNGPGTCVPLCSAAFLFKVLLFRPCSLVFVESFCRVESVSLSGRLLYPVVDEFVVQWPQLAASAAATDAQRADGAMSPTAESQSKGWKYVKYIGRLC